MKTLKLLLTRIPSSSINLKPLLLLIIGVLLWTTLPQFLIAINPTVGLVDGGVWQLLLFSIIAYLLLLFMSMMLFDWLLFSLALPKINTMVSQFNTLSLWQQLGFYWASFALFLLTAVGCLAAVI